MPEPLGATRIIVIDDNRAIHEDFRKILRSGPAERSSLDESEAVLFGRPAPTPAHPRFEEVDFASQGLEGVALVQQARSAGRPYALAFVDMRMPPGLDGIETTLRIWEVDPDVRIVICSAYSDHSWQDILQSLGHTEQLFILKKPFDNIEVLQLAGALTRQWQSTQATRRRILELESLVASSGTGRAL